MKEKSLRKKQTKLKKIALLTSISFCVVMLSIVLISFLIYMFFYLSSNLNSMKLNGSQAQTKIFDMNNVEITEQLQTIDYIEIQNIPKIIQDAFICQEDKRFLSHSGIDIKRMGKAFWVNLTTGRVKQGASTISQQLIKNTHLSNKKTLTRKIKEIALARKMEKKLSKEEILERYLNVIYFGNNCYGISNASKYYFGKSINKLETDEIASLVAIISAPSHYSPTASISANHKKRNIVLKNLYNAKKITNEDYIKYKEKETMFNINKNLKQSNNYVNNALDEASEILKISKIELLSNSYKIYTGLNYNKQRVIQDIVDSINNSNDILMISIDNHTKLIDAYFGKSSLNLLNISRQPGSAIKPLLVYAPAYENNIVSPCSIIKDEEINLNGYRPQNVNKKFNGNVSVRESLSRSLNIPAVKILSYTGIEESKDYLKKMNVNFSEKDIGYALALGGMTNGISLKTLSNCYVPFINQGQFYDAKFINYITDKNGKIIYKNNLEYKQIYSQDSAYLTFDGLKTCAMVGTAKKLQNITNIGAKTGTVGNGEKNTDAYCITCCSDGVLACWLGSTNNANIKTTGSAIPTECCKDFYQDYLKNKIIAPIVVPDTIVKEDIDMISLKNFNKIELASEFTPERYIISEIFSKNNAPTNISRNFLDLDKPITRLVKKDNKNYIEVDCLDYLDYEIISIDKKGTEKVQSIISNKGTKETLLVEGLENVFVRAKIKKYADNIKVISKDSDIYEFGKTNSKLIKNDSKWYL